MACVQNPAMGNGTYLQGIAAFSCREAWRLYRETALVFIAVGRPL